MTQEEANEFRGHKSHDHILYGFVEGRQEDCLLDAMELLHFAEVPANIRLYIRLRNYLRSMVDMLNSVCPDHPDDWKARYWRDIYWLDITPNNVRLCKSINVFVGIELRKDVIFLKVGNDPVEVITDYETAPEMINKVILPLIRTYQAPFRPDDYTINGVKQ